MEYCINIAMYRIFGSCDRSNFEYIIGNIQKMCVTLENMTDLIERKCEKFVDQLIRDGRFTNLLFIYSWNVFGK